MDDLQDKLIAIGVKIRRLRRERNMSLQQLAERSGVSAAAIHKIERNDMVPTVATLLKLSSALNRPVGYFVEEAPDENKPAVLIRAGQRRQVFTSKHGIDLKDISGPYGRFFMHGAVAEIEPGADSGPEPMVHPGEELVFLLEGEMSFNVDGDVYTLAAGDTLHFRPDRPHVWRNPGDAPARAVWMTLRSS